MNQSELNQTDHCLQFYCAERSVSTAVYVLLCVSAAALVLLTVCENLLVIISVCHFKQLHTPTNMLILSLAVSDFLFGALVIPIALTWIIEKCWIFNRGFCISFVLTASFLKSTCIYTVALIAADRYFALSNPFLYTKAVSVSVMCSVVLCYWFILFFYNLAVHYFSTELRGVVMCPGDCFLLFSEAWYLVDLVFIFLFPITLIVILYVQVFVIAKKHATAIRELNIQTRPETSKKDVTMKSERKAAKVLGIVVFVFLACYFPYFIYTVLGRVIEVEVASFQKVLILVYLNSAINPVIYALFYPWFRRCVKIILMLQIFQKDSVLINVLS